MGQIAQVIGSLLVLAGFAAAQRGWVNPTSRRYLALNLIGSAVLAVEAVAEQQWGFLILESVWAMVSGAGLIAALIGTRVHRSASSDEPGRRIVVTRG